MNNSYRHLLILIKHLTLQALEFSKARLKILIFTMQNLISSAENVNLQDAQ